MRISILAYLLLLSNSYAKIPDWAARNTTKLNGSVLTTICHGTGPSLDIARTEALHACQANAGQYLKSKIRIKSLSVETEKSVGFHQEIISDDEIEGLTCNPQRDEVEETESQFNVWIECKFDLKKVSLASSPTFIESGNSKLNELEVSKVKPKTDVQGKYIFISTAPKCDSVLIRGNTSRIVECRQNPLKIQINDHDQEILVRAKGYKPKTINVKGVNSNESIQVLMDLL